MMTPFNKRAYGAVVSAFALLLLTGCSSSIVPLSSSGTAASSGGTSQSTYSGATTTVTVTVYTGVTGSTGTTSTTTPLVSSATPWNSAKLAEGDTHSCLVDTSGGVWCWGLNTSGQLGNNTTTNAKYVTKASTLTSGVQMIAAGGSHTCAIDASGGVWCWGANDSGQLGTGTYTDSHVPAKVSGLSSGIVSLAAGFSHTCAVDTRGNIWCWGSNVYGQLGNNTTTTSTTPVMISTAMFSNGAVAIALGNHHSCATDSLGSLFCWGYNDSGRLGDGTTTNRSIPTQVLGLTSGVKVVSAGYIHTCAVDASGTLWCWGSNYYGQLGTGDSTAGTTTPVLSPMALTGLSIGVQTLSLGGYHTCVTDGSNVSCWGDNKYGQAGLTPSFAYQSLPNAVTGISGTIRGMALGGYHSCVLDAIGMQCWGNNQYDQLGDGTYVSQSAPVQVYKVTAP